MTRTICPRCGQVGYSNIRKITSKGHTYYYWVISHGKVSHVIRRANSLEVKLYKRDCVDIIRDVVKAQAGARGRTIDMAEVRELLYKVYVKRKSYTREEKERANEIFRAILGARKVVLL